MTLQEALLEVYESTDEQSDMNIYSGGSVSLSAPGSLRIISLLKRAQNAVSVWKFPGGRRLRFRFMLDSFYALVPVIDDLEIDSGGTYPGFVLPVIQSPAFANDYLVGATLFIGTEAYPIVGNTGNSVTLAKEVATDPGGTITTVSWQTWNPTFPVGKEPIQIVGLYNPSSDSSLARGADRDRLLSGALSLGQPTSYLPTSSGVMFDTCPEEQLYLKVLFQRYPLMPASLAATFELPVSFHDAICEYAKYTANMRIGKSENAQMAWSRLNSIMASTRQEADLEEDLVDKSVAISEWQ